MVLFDSRYTLSSWSRYHGPGGLETAISIRINGRKFTVILFPGDFENSPLRSLELRNTLDSLHGPSWDDEDAETDSGVYVASPPGPMNDWHRIEDAIEWAIRPYLNVFEGLAPPPAENVLLTLAHLYHKDAFLCRLRSSNDQFVLEEVQQYSSVPYIQPMMSLLMNQTDEEQPHSAWRTSFPCFSPEEVEVCSEQWYIARDLQRVTWYSVNIIGNKEELYHKRFRDEDEGKGEILKYEQMVNADLGLNVKILRPSGVVKNEAGKPTGLLLPYFYSVRVLEPEIRTRPSNELAERWMRQIETALSALHTRGIVWGNAGPRDVLIDTNDDAWIVDFGDKRRIIREDGLDANSVEGDLRGIQAIREYIQNQPM